MKYILVQEHTDFTQAIGIYDNFYTALGRAYDFILEISNESELPTLPAYIQSDYDTGYYIRYRGADGYDKACMMWILTLEEGADGN